MAFFLLLPALAFVLSAAAPYRTVSHTSDIRSLQVYHGLGWDRSPVLEMEDGEVSAQVLITFDEMSHDFHRYAYRIVHCNADWTPSGMMEMEYLEGFPENDVPEGECSRATARNYTHYEFCVPNDDVRLKLSGNYAVEVFDRDDASATVLTACFSVVDAQMQIEAEAGTLTDLGANLMHQQIEFSVKTGMGQVTRPEEELKTLVRQNRRTDNEVALTAPQMISSDRIFYRHRRELIFEAGNEYRRFEFIHSKTGGMGVGCIRFIRPDYHLYLYESEPRTGGYSYDEDQNGRYLVYTSQLFNDSPVEADYFVVHFTLPMAQRLNPDRLFILGDLSCNRFDESSRMVWNEQSRCYEGSLLLKQGSYNYMYVWEKNGHMTTARTDGNYWQTENEYEIFVYYRPFGASYDALVAYTTLTCKP